MQGAPENFGIASELLAAKMVGRWRSGTPLMLSPNSSIPTTPIPEERLNSLEYTDDAQGQKCPIGAHMRRSNPRSEPIAGGDGLKHRIVRRGLPYGPPYDAHTPNDGNERGLLGIFICVSLKDQFEFLMSQWVNRETFAAEISGTKDPILGNHPDNGGRFIISVDGQAPIVVTGFSRLVQTRGAAYAFLPILSALKYIAAPSR